MMKRYSVIDTLRDRVLFQTDDLVAAFVGFEAECRKVRFGFITLRDNESLLPLAEAIVDGEPKRGEDE